MSRELRERFDTDPDSLRDRDLALLAIHMIGEAMTQLTDLTAGLTDLDTAVDAAVARVAAGPDLSAELATVASIKAKVEGIDPAPATPASPAVDPAAGPPQIDAVTGQPIPPA